MARSLAQSLVVLALCGLFAAACKPKAGGKCSKEGKEVCQDKGSALVCHDGKWETMACRGSTGCVGVGDSASCDNVVADENDVCNLEGDFACTTDKKAYLQCANKKWTAAGPCRGPAGCAANAKTVTCDSSIAREGDACSKKHEGDHACAEDRKSSLKCSNGKYAVVSKCGGPKGCRVKGQDPIECDDSVSEIGDPCDLADHYACAKDGRAILVCRDHKFVKDEDCKKKTCKIVGDKVGCS